MCRILALTVLLCVAGIGCAADDAEIMQRLAASVMKVNAFNKEGRLSVGSGVMLAVDRVGTNCHVTRDAQRVELVFQHQKFIAESERRDPLLDICVLHVKGIMAPVAQWGEAPQIGDAVYAAGFSGGQRMRISAGSVYGLFEFDGGCVIQATATFDLGASGGGLFDAQGRLVGFTTFKTNGGEQFHFSIPASWSKALLGDIAPGALTRGETPFWYGAVDKLPNFLRTVAYESLRDWTSMLDSAERWSRSESGSPEPLFARARALIRMGRPADALMPLEQAVTRYPSHTTAMRQWLELRAKSVSLPNTNTAAPIAAASQ